MSRFDREPPWHVALYLYGAMMLWVGMAGLFLGPPYIPERCVVGLICGIALLIAGRTYQVRSGATSVGEPQK